MAGFNYWFPKAFGFKLDERWGKAAFWCWLVGFYVAFMPLYALGLMGMTRRMQHYDDKSWQPFLIVAAVGVAIIMAGIACQAIQLVVTIRARNNLRVGDDPWSGRTLEWSTASPPPAWNFSILPDVIRADAFWMAKQQAQRDEEHLDRSGKYKPVDMPKNSAIGFISAFFAVVTGFALIWHIWWMAGLGLIGAFMAFLIFAFRDEEEVTVSVERIAQFERRHHAEGVAP
jgi:cytochrome o ubiquinol oxidase subunit I